MTVSPANLLEPTTLPGKGRSFITKQAVKAGELLLSVEPYAAVPDTKHTDLLCSHCQSLQGVTSKMVDGERILNRPSALKQSEDSGKSGPNLWWYCSSTQCEQQDLPYRSFEQSFFSVPANWKRFNQFTDYTKDYVRLLIRCLIRRWYESKGDALSSTIDGDGMLFDKDVMALCTNRSGFPADRMTEFKSVSEFLHEFLECTGLNGIDGKEKLTVDQLVDLVCREECNSFGLYSFIEDAAYGEPKYAYGLALYPQAAYFNHSCAPNVVHRTASAVAGKKQMFYAVCDIAEGKELCISYISLTNCYEKRIQELNQVFLFTCQCERCKSRDTDQKAQIAIRNYLCQSAGCQGVYLPANSDNNNNDDLSIASTKHWQCNACKSSRRLATETTDK